MVFDFKGLIQNQLVEHTKATINNNDYFTYYIDRTIGSTNLQQWPVLAFGTLRIEDIEIYNIGHEDSWQNYIRDSFKKLDEIIDLDFKEMLTNNGSMLDIYHVNYSSIFEKDTIGVAISQKSNYGSWWEILWKDSNLSGSRNLKSNHNTILHEIGHCLGLSHPFDDGFNILWDSEDTVMSYNRGEAGWNDWFSNNDLNALISIWGREDDLGYMNFPKNSFEYKYTKLANDSYAIKTDIGLESINNINNLKFKDKSINIKNDIVDVFNLIKEVDDITGKVYRLYNAAFGRFPDKEGLIYWINTNSSGKDTMRKTAKSFIISKEFIDLYGLKTSNTDYINNLYKNVLNRPSDIDGFEYWLNQIEKGYEDKSELLIGFSESFENKLIFSNETNIF